MTNTTITNFRKNVFEYVNQAIQYNDAVNVVTRNGNAVLISEEEYNGMLETLRLMSVPGMTESILEAAKEPTEACAEYDPDEEW